MSATSRPSAFGALLLQHRRAAGLSQEELAELAGVSADAVAALEGLAGVVHDRGRLVALVRRSLGPGAFGEAMAAGRATPARDVVEGPLDR